MNDAATPRQGIPVGRGAALRGAADPSLVAPTPSLPRMTRLPLIVASIVVAAAATTAFTTAAPRQPRTAQVMVHCPAGNREAFVTPPRVTVSVGDDIEWRVTGQVASDSIVISLKDGDQQWPFTGRPSRGGTSARARNAQTPGTYGYNVTLQCRIPGQGVQEVVIDPDIIVN